MRKRGRKKKRDCSVTRGERTVGNVVMRRQGISHPLLALSFSISLYIFTFFSLPLDPTYPYFAACYACAFSSVPSPVFTFLMSIIASISTNSFVAPLLQVLHATFKQIQKDWCSFLKIHRISKSQNWSFPKKFQQRTWKRFVNKKLDDRTNEFNAKRVRRIITKRISIVFLRNHIRQDLWDRAI